MYLVNIFLNICCNYFDRKTILINYLFIYLDHIKVNDKLKDKKITLVPMKSMFFWS